MINSAIYRGKVFHSRFIPKQHHFFYHIFLLWLDLDELTQLDTQIRGFSSTTWAPVRFKRSDYLGDQALSLKDATLQRMSQLAGTPLQGKVFMLGQVRMFGMYFSPVNFYYLQNNAGDYTHMLAEVSNTPWNERHHYLVDLKKQADSEKAFHVSPFNPIDMQYQWNVKQPGEKLRLALNCIKNTKHFSASLQLSKLPLNSASLFRVMLSIPSMTIKTVVGIYWQALKLLIKGVPIYPHTVKSKE